MKLNDQLVKRGRGRGRPQPGPRAGRARRGLGRRPGPATDDSRQRIFAAAGGNLRSTALLVEKGNADIEARDDRSLTPLMAAALGGYAEVVEYLLKHGADASVTGRGGATARSLAEERKYTPIVRILDEHAKKAAAVDDQPAAGEAKVPTGSGKP